MDRTAFHELLAAAPDRVPDDPEGYRASLLSALGYDPGAVAPVDDADAVEPIAADQPVVEDDRPGARRFVLKVGTDPLDDPPVPDHPEGTAYPSLRGIYEELAVDYVVQVTDHRLILFGEDLARTYVLSGAPDLDDRPTFEPLTADAAAELYVRLAVDAGPDEQSSLADY